MRVIPALDVLGGKAVRLLRGDYDEVSEYGDDPVAIARGFMDEGASLVHVVDLDAARGRERSLDVVRALGIAGVPFQIGGGIRSPEVAAEVVALGARRVVVGSAFLGGEATAIEIVEAVGAEHVVAALDVREGRARGSGWLDEGLPLSDALDVLAGAGVRRALVTGIETDGTMDGPAFGLFAQVRELAPDLEVIASGGVGTLDDISDLRASEVDIEAVIVGRALYEGRFTLGQAVETAR
ncbi:MAG: 1-(5-phosphoribosyl)-5-[(5-phosphoribosylamino)methylideneamino] imidazole-4-carboxamide isomerase [Actinomycetota bacterium]